MALLEVVSNPHDPIRVSGVPEAREAGKSGPTLHARGPRVEPALQVAPGGGDRSACPGGGRAFGGHPRRGRRLLRTMDGRGEGTHDQLSERRPPDGEVPRERGGPSSARDRPQQTPLLTDEWLEGSSRFISRPSAEPTSVP